MPYKQKPPKSLKKKVEVYSQNEYERILKATKDYTNDAEIKWDLLILLALTTGMRRGELLNCVYLAISDSLVERARIASV